MDYSEKDQLQQLSWPQRHKLAEAMMYSARRYEVIARVQTYTAFYVFFDHSLICRCGDAIPKYAGDFIGAFVRGAATRPPHNGSEEVDSYYSPSHLHIYSGFH